MTITEKLAKVQRELKAPKYRMNKFGGYAYRSCEDIMEAIKPCMPAGCVVTVSDEITAVADRVYVKATARFTDGEATVEVTAFAREADARKGMDDSQVTGSASSYARKFALNGLFMIDDNKDADADHPPAEKQEAKGKKLPTLADDRLLKAIEAIKSGNYPASKLFETYGLNDGQLLMVRNAGIEVPK